VLGIVGVMAADYGVLNCTRVIIDLPLTDLLLFLCDYSHSHLILISIVVGSTSQKASAVWFEIKMDIGEHDVDRACTTPFRDNYLEWKSYPTPVYISCHIYSQGVGIARYE
jgi:hypothetical protein